MLLKIKDMQLEEYVYVTNCKRNSYLSDILSYFIIHLKCIKKNEMF